MSSREVLQEAIDVCQSLDGDFIAKGSVVRSEAPYGDLDLLVVADEDVQECLPDELLGVEVSTNRLSKTQLEEYLDATPRAWYLLVEHRRLKVQSTELEEILDRGLDKLMRYRLPDYLLYHAVEHEAYSRRTDLTDDSYYCKKRLPGSKRSIMRGVYMLKTMNPQYYAIQSTDTFLRVLEGRGLLPNNLRDDIQAIYLMLKNSQYSEDWEQRTSRTEQWVRSLQLQAFEISRANLPVYYSTAIDDALNSALGGNKLQTLTSIRTHLPAYRRWTLDLALTANANAPPELLLNMFRRGKNDYSRRAINRFLLRNPAFPLAEIPRNELEDFHLRGTLERLGRVSMSQNL